MNHEDAIRDNLAAGYILGDLSGAERDAFEEHYIDCRVCSDTIRSGAIMMAAGHEVVKSERRFRRDKLMTWVPSAAAAALAAVVAYQSFVVIPGIRNGSAAETLTPGDFITGTMRAGGGVDEDIRFQFVGNRSRLEHVEITDRKFPHYRIEVRNAAGEVVASTDATAEEVRSSEMGVPFLLRPLPAGRYELVVEGVQTGGNRSSITRRSLVVQ